MTYGLTLDNSWELMSEEEMYDVNGGGIFDWSSDKFLKNLDGLFSGIRNNLPMGIGVILSSISQAAVLGYSYVIPFFPKLAAAVAAVPLPGFRVVAATLAVSAAALVTSMGYFRMFY